MARKVIIDCDPGIADAVALCMALFDPRLDVIAATGVGGAVPAPLATANLQSVIGQLDPPRNPRVGAGAPLETAPQYDHRPMHGEDGLGTWSPPSPRFHQYLAEKLICEEVRAAPEDITILCLGPLTNIARAFQRDPQLASLVGRLIIVGGSPQGIGDITPSAEFNIFYDPESARQVFRSATTKTLIPLDVTRRVKLTLGLMDELPSESTRAGLLFRRLFPFAFRAHHENLGQESICLPEAVAVVAALHPELFETIEMAGDVEVEGELTTGATIFDRRPKAVWRANMEVAIDIDAAAVNDAIVRGLQRAGNST